MNIGLIIVITYVVSAVIIMGSFFVKKKEHKETEEPIKALSVVDRIKVRSEKVRELNRELKKKGLIEIVPIVNGHQSQLDLGREPQILLIDSFIDYQDQSEKEVAPMVLVMGKDGEEFDFRLDQTYTIVNDERIYDEILAEWYCNS